MPPTHTRLPPWYLFPPFHTPTPFIIFHTIFPIPLQAQQLCELEGASGLEASGSGPAFKVLKTLVESWLADAGKRSNP